jgi:hypothetical protein
VAGEGILVCLLDSWFFYLVKPKETRIIAIVVWFDYDCYCVVVFGAFLLGDEVAVGMGLNAGDDAPAFAAYAH